MRGAGEHVEAAPAPVDPARLARVDRGLASRDSGLAQAGGQVRGLKQACHFGQNAIGKIGKLEAPGVEEEQQEHLR